jgi:hypothetical protein
MSDECNTNSRKSCSENSCNMVVTHIVTDKGLKAVHYCPRCGLTGQQMLEDQRAYLLDVLYKIQLCANAAQSAEDNPEQCTYGLLDNALDDLHTIRRWAQEANIHAAVWPLPCGGTRPRYGHDTPMRRVFDKSPEDPPLAP